MTRGEPRSICSSNSSMSAHHRNGLRTHFRAVLLLDRGVKQRIQMNVEPLEAEPPSGHDCSVRARVGSGKEFLDPICEFDATKGMN
jgi:hypothetical protein